MIKTLELTTPTSCLNKSADDEPLFVLTGRDAIAPMVVRQWAILYGRLRTGEGQRNLTFKQRNKFNEAMATAVLMELWRTRK